MQTFKFISCIVFDKYPIIAFVTGGSRKATRVTLGIAISIWLLAILCALPAALGSHLMVIKEGFVEITVCYPFPTHWLNHNYPKVNVMMRFLILYIIPLLIIAVFYLKMANHLIMSTKNVPGEMQGTQRQVGTKSGLRIQAVPPKTP